jgi:hypothetical protein
VRTIAKRDGTDIAKCGESYFFLALALLLIGVVSCPSSRIFLPIPKVDDQLPVSADGSLFDIHV